MPFARGAACLLTLVLCLSACDPNGGRLSGDGLAPVGMPDGTEAPDGLVVGHRLMAAGEYELALSAYQRAVAVQGLNVDTLSAIGSANLKLARLQQARRFLTLATEQDPEFTPAWNNLGVVLTSLGEYEAAHQAFTAAFALDNGASEEIWQNLLLALKNLQDNKRAVRDDAAFRLVRRGNGRFLLLETPQNRG